MFSLDCKGPPILIEPQEKKSAFLIKWQRLKPLPLFYMACISGGRLRRLLIYNRNAHPILRVSLPIHHNIGNENRKGGRLHKLMKRDVLLPQKECSVFFALRYLSEN